MRGETKKNIETGDAGRTIEFPSMRPDVSHFALGENMGLDIDMNLTALDLRPRRRQHRGKKTRIYLLEFSFSQKAFHIEMLDDATSNNFRLLRNAMSQKLDYVPDYLPIAWSQSRVELNTLKDKIETELR